jgi:hypothetical protein
MAQKKWFPILFVGAGAMLVLFGKQLFGYVIEDIEEGIHYRTNGFRLKFTGNLLTIPVINIKIPQYLSLIIEMSFENRNPIGGKVNSFTGSVRYGKGGTLIGMVTNSGFDLPPNQSRNVAFQTNIDLITAPSAVKEILSKVKAGEYKKLWLDGKVYITVGGKGIVINMSRELSILEI